MRKKKIALLLSAALLLMLIATAAVRHFALPTMGLGPAELAAAATDDLLSLDSLTFHTQTELTINSDTVSLGKIDGQINGENLHIWGNVLGSDLNIYQIGATTYRQDTLTDQWLTTDDGELLTNASLLADADPRSLFRLSGINNAEEANQAEINGQKCRGVSFCPTTADGSMEKYFDNIKCTIWVGRDNHIMRTEIAAEAVTSGQSSTLTLTCDFSEWNTTPAITPPIIQPAA